MTEAIADEKIKETVRQAYGGIARRFVEEPEGGAEARSAQASCCGPSEAAVESAEAAAQTSCCGSSQAEVESAEALAEADLSCCGPEGAVESTGSAVRLYSAEELTELPDTVTGASLGCGNPTAIAELQPGEVVLDLGSGGGIDCFLAARKVGPEGRVIGLDMTPDMIKLARRNAKKVGATNVDFRYGEMEEMPLPDASVDVIISNCVINLSGDKDRVLTEAFRVLRPGGRFAVSDIVTRGALPEPARASIALWTGCVAGALDQQEYVGKLTAAGFVEAAVEPTRIYTREDVQSYLGEAGLEGDKMASQLDGRVMGAFIRARKPS
jgi:arsenite methyltransferase